MLTWLIHIQWGPFFALVRQRDVQRRQSPALRFPLHFPVFYCIVTLNIGRRRYLFTEHYAIVSHEGGVNELAWEAPCWSELEICCINGLPNRRRVVCSRHRPWRCSCGDHRLPERQAISEPNRDSQKWQQTEDLLHSTASITNDNTWQWKWASKTKSIGHKILFY